MKLAFDIGATHTRLAFIDRKSLCNIQRFETDTSDNGIETLLQTASGFVRGTAIDEAVGGLPGQLDRTSGRLVHAPNLPNWSGRRVARELSQHLGVPVRCHNDVEMVGLGEAVFGAGRGHGIVAYVTVSTGVNGARIVDGRIDDSARGFEIGSELVTGTDGYAHGLEELTGGAAMARRYGRPPRSLHDARIWAQEARYLAYGLYNTILHWSPDAVVMGGSMMRDIDTEAIATELRRLPRVYDHFPPVKKAELADDGGLYGALVLGRDYSPTAA